MQPSPPQVATQVAARPSTADSLAIEAASERTLLSLAEALPSNTQLLVLLRDPFRFLDRLGRVALVEKFPERYAEAIQQSESWFGVDLTAPEGFAAVGLDPHGPLGVAILAEGSEVVALVCTVRDPARLRSGAHAWVDLTAETVGPAVLLADADNDTMAVLLEGGLALLLHAEDADVPRIARRLAKRSRVDRLDSSETFARAMSGLDTRRDGVAYLNVADDLDSGLAAMLPRLFGVGTAFEVRGSSLHAELHVAMSPDHPLVRVARSAKPSPATGAPIVRWLDEAPGVVLHVHVDPDVLGLELADTAAGFLTFLGSGLDLDLQADVVPALDGSIGLAVVRRTSNSGSDSPPGELDERNSRWTYTVFLGLREPELARRLLERLVASPPGARYALQRSGRDYETADGDARVGLRDRVLVVTNDQQGFTTLDPQTTGHFSWPADGAREPFLVGWDSARIWDQSALDIDPDWTVDEPFFEDDDTPEIRKLVEELHSLEKEQADLVRQRLKAQREASAGLQEHLGSSWIALGSAPDGLRGHITHTYPASTFADGVMRLAEYWERDTRVEERFNGRQQALVERIEAVVDEIDQLRAQNQP